MKSSGGHTLFKSSRNSDECPSTDLEKTYSQMQAEPHENFYDKYYSGTNEKFNDSFSNDAVVFQW
jgi:hypothetical protein